MTAVWTFFKKEMRETVKTSKAIVLPIVFVFFGIVSPLTAKYINLLLGVAAKEQGLEIRFSDPTYVDSYLQFFKNLNFMALMVLILIFAGSIVEEKSRGTATLVLTKCLSKKGFVLSKVTAAISLFTGSFVLSAGAFLYYTWLLFPGFPLKGMAWSMLIYWVYAVFTIAVTLLASCLARTFTMAAVGSFGIYALTSLLSSIPKVGKYTPAALQGLFMEYLKGAQTISETVLPVAITFLLAVAAIWSCVRIFERQEL